ncbi:inorganic phosphate transporter [Fangia hongkongensis]|uniref:inorganic phosphate transporter n=2 Tax=Fangia hongkongensis TaxID=270495 RepID=UPI000373F482|nr:inorganic phosphate transporter [Fangia hongkongensis]
MLIVLICIIVIALFFEFINGFHDVANVVATPIASKSLSPYQAIILAAIFNFVGAFLGTAVATTISKGLVDANVITHLVLISALIAAIGWNLFTWYFGIPSSSSHALIGSLVGAAIAVSNFQSVHYGTLIGKVIIPMIFSPILAFFIALILVIIVFRILSKSKRPRKANNFVRELQVFSSSLLALSHGSNDAQKTMSIITLALFSFGVVSTVSHIPVWVIALCALTMALGTLAGGMRIIKTLTTRVAKLGPANSFSAELSSGLLILGASHVGLPVSTTQAASGSIMGAGYPESGGVNWRVVKAMATAWLLTLPCCMITSFVIYKLLALIFGDLGISLNI